jgi:hypothetical protein
MADEPWTARELHEAIERVQRTRGWTWLSTPRHPAAYLARLLREIEALDQLSERVSPAAAARRAQAEREQLRQAELHERLGRDLCAHGVAGADPDTGTAFRCAFCRHTNRSGVPRSGIAGAPGVAGA